MRLFDRHEQGIILQPGGIFSAKRCKFGLNRSRVRRETPESFFQQGWLPQIQPPEIHPLLIPGRHVRQIFILQ